LTLNQGALIREINIVKAIGKIDLINQYIIIGQKEKRHFFKKLPNNFKYISISFINRTIWEFFTLPIILRKLKSDIVYSPHHKSMFFSFCKKIIVIHNIAPFDKNIIKNSSFYQQIRLILLRIGTRLSVYNSNYTIFLSNTLKDAMIQYKIIPSNASLIYHGIPAGFMPKKDLSPSFNCKLNLNNGYILYISHLYKYKNTLELVKAFAKIKDSYSVNLLIIGKIADLEYYNKINDFIKLNNIEDRIDFVGFVEHELLPYLYSFCTFFIFPSTCENAPVTLLEAMACGAPIACSKLSGMPETCGKAALYFDPYNVSEISSTMKTMLDNSSIRNKMSVLSLNRAKEFSWIKSAKNTQNIFKEVYNME
jgi:glycosyltransferase involved in cell wall biosynthesis